MLPNIMSICLGCDETADRMIIRENGLPLFFDTDPTTQYNNVSWEKLSQVQLYFWGP